MIFSLWFTFAVCDAWSAVRAEDDAATDETESFGRRLHRDIVGVGVKPEIADFRKAVVNTHFQDTPTAAVRSQTVDCAIGIIVGPGSVDNNSICWILTLDKSEDSHYAARTVRHNMTVPARYVF